CIKNPNRFLSITSDKRSVRWLWRDSVCFFVLLFAFFFMAVPSRMHFRFSRKRFGTATSSLSVDQHATGHSLLVASTTITVQTAPSGSSLKGTELEAQKGIQEVRL